MPNTHMIEHSHIGPIATLLVGGAWGLIAQATPEVSAIEGWGPLTLCGIAIVWLVKENTKEREYSRSITKEHQDKISSLVDRSVEATHANQMATEKNTAALNHLNEKFNELIGRTRE